MTLDLVIKTKKAQRINFELFDKWSGKPRWFGAPPTLDLPNNQEDALPFTHRSPAVAAQER
jgi:hypothetical protein